MPKISALEELVKLLLEEAHLIIDGGETIDVEVTSLKPGVLSS
jgi:hypothetical protein